MLPRAHLEVFSPEERRTFLSKKLGLNPDLFTVFLATGGNGAHNHFALLPTLLRHAQHVQAIVICGKNKQVHNDLLRWRSTHPGFNCYIEGYSEIVHLLMQASDVIVTRGGTTTCAKALHFRCPIIFNAFGGIMPQEQLTWKFFHNGAGCHKVESMDEFDELIDGWVANPETYQRARDRFLQLRYEEDPTVIIDELIGLANEVANAKVRRRSFPPQNGSAALVSKFVA
jgi:processive 1,2-diacylglycerol beta-glucosyltransferase